MSKAAAADLYERVFREVDYTRKEYDMTYAEAVGVLQIVAWQLMKETDDECEEEDDDDE